MQNGTYFNKFLDATLLRQLWSTETLTSRTAPVLS